MSTWRERSCRRREASLNRKYGSRPPLFHEPRDECPEPWVPLDHHCDDAGDRSGYDGLDDGGEEFV